MSLTGDFLGNCGLCREELLREQRLVKDLDLSFLHGGNFHRVQISWGFKFQSSASRVPNVMYQGWDGFLSLRILM